MFRFSFSDIKKFYEVKGREIHFTTLVAAATSVHPLRRACHCGHISRNGAKTRENAIEKIASSVALSKIFDFILVKNLI